MQRGNRLNGRAGNVRREKYVRCRNDEKKGAAYHVKALLAAVAPVGRTALLRCPDHPTGRCTYDDVSILKGFADFGNGSEQRRERFLGRLSTCRQGQVLRPEGTPTCQPRATIHE